MIGKKMVMFTIVSIIKISKLLWKCCISFKGKNLVKWFYIFPIQVILHKILLPKFFLKCFIYIYISLQVKKIVMHFIFNDKFDMKNIKSLFKWKMCVCGLNSLSFPGGVKVERKNLPFSNFLIIYFICNLYCLQAY